MNLLSSRRVIMFSDSKTPSQRKATAGKEGHLHFAVVEQEFHVLDGRGIGQVALVVLQHVRDVGEVEFERFEIVLEVLEALDVFRHLVVLRIGHKNDAVHAAQNQLPGGVVNDLARNGVKLKFGLETLDGHGFNGQKIEKQRAVRTGGQGNQLALLLHVLHVAVDLFEIGRLAALARAVINDFDLQFLGRLIDDRHNESMFRLGQLDGNPLQRRLGQGLPRPPDDRQAKSPGLKNRTGALVCGQLERAQFAQLDFFGGIADVSEHLRQKGGHHFRLERRGHLAGHQQSIPRRQQCAGDSRHCLNFLDNLRGVRIGF